MALLNSSFEAAGTRPGEAAVPNLISVAVVRRSQLQDALLGDGGKRAQA